MNRPNQKETLEKFLNDNGLKAVDVAQASGVQAGVYRLLSGKDIRLTTWNKIRAAMDASLYRGRRPGPEPERAA